MDFNLNKLKEYVDIYQITSAANRVKNAIYNYSYFEIRTREATNNEKWGPGSAHMQEIAQATNDPRYLNEIINTIIERIRERKEHKWRQVHKTLLLVDYLIKCGSEKVIDSLRRNILLFKQLVNFTYTDSSGMDCGEAIRKRAAMVIELLENTQLIRDERKKFSQNKDRFVGLSSNNVIKNSYSLNMNDNFSSNRNAFGNNFNSYTVDKFGGEYKDDENFNGASSNENNNSFKHRYNQSGQPPSKNQLHNFNSTTRSHKPPSEQNKLPQSLLIDIDEDILSQTNNEKVLNGDEKILNGNENTDKNSDNASWGEFISSASCASNNPRVSSINKSVSETPTFNIDNPCETSFLSAPASSSRSVTSQNSFSKSDINHYPPIKNRQMHTTNSPHSKRTSFNSPSFIAPNNSSPQEKNHVASSVKHNPYSAKNTRDTHNSLIDSRTDNDDNTWDNDINPNVEKELNEGVKNGKSTLVAPDEITENPWDE